MPLRSVYIRSEDLDAWKALKKKSEAISAMLNGNKKVVRYARPGDPRKGEPTVVELGNSKTGYKEPKEIVKQDKRNPDVQLVVDTWLQEVGPPDGTQAENRRFAKLLIQKHGLERSVGAVKAVKPSRSLRFNPSITSIKDLYYKFGKLEEAYSREKKNQQDPERELTPEELKKEFGL